MGRADQSGTATIYDVAAAAGVATSTVSRAFSHPERVSGATRAHILKVAESLGYRPSPLPPAGTGRRRGTITMTIGDIANPYHWDVLRAAEQRAAKFGYTVAISDNGESERTELDNLRHLLSLSAGALLVTSRLPDPKIAELATKRPVVLLNRRVRGVNTLISDSAASFRKATRHLHALGHRKVLYLAGPQNSWANHARWTAIAAEAARLGMLASKTKPYEPTMTAGGRAAADGFPPEVTAVLTYNDLLAIGALTGLRAQGVRVPEDISVVGCDDIFGADFTNPPLTTVAMPGAVLGEKGIEVLISLITGAGRSPVDLAFPTQLRIRKSTGPPRQRDRRS